MSALDNQVGGDHYKGRSIQPVEYWHANNLDAFQGTVIKHVTRWREKGGLDDLRKAIHYLELYIELEMRAQKVRAKSEEISGHQLGANIIRPRYEGLDYQREVRDQSSNRK